LRAQRARLRSRRAPAARVARRRAGPSPEQRAAHAAANGAINRRDQALTRAQAGRRGASWSPEDDRYLLEQWHRTAREQALALGRTLWSVRRRRTHLRRAQAAPGRAAATGQLAAPEPGGPRDRRPGGILDAPARGGPAPRAFRNGRARPAERDAPVQPLRRR